MKTNRIHISFNLLIAAAAAALAPLIAATTPAHAGDPNEASKDIIAVQLRKQGFACSKALSAQREANVTKYDDAAWILKCDNASYKVQLIPNMAAKVEILSDDVRKDEVKGTSP